MTDKKQKLCALFFGFLPAKDQWVPHISLVFREMWEMRTLMFFASGVENGPVERSGIPHLAKDERDMGHPLIRGASRRAKHQWQLNQDLFLISHPPASPAHGVMKRVCFLSVHLGPKAALRD